MWRGRGGGRGGWSVSIWNPKIPVLSQRGEQGETLPCPGGWGGRQSEAGPVGGGDEGSLLPTLQSRDPHDCPLRKNSSNLLAVFLINTKDLQ